ncbi:hypothetical protein GQ600_773 [Phytophthora cactorum]|nr:hypothetical protein GQ600_773 [Phytophthora cactorum]
MWRRIADVMRKPTKLYRRSNQDDEEEELIDYDKLPDFEELALGRILPGVMIDIVVVAPAITMTEALEDKNIVAVVAVAEEDQIAQNVHEDRIDALALDQAPFSVTSYKLVA